jgi:integrase
LTAPPENRTPWKLTVPPAKSDVLCKTPRGTLLRRDYYNRQIWKPAIAAAGLAEDTTFHDLRHTFASTALAEGVPISEVSRWLGHKSITTTVDLYGHLVPEASGRARDALDKAFDFGACAPDVPQGPGDSTGPQVRSLEGG